MKNCLLCGEPFSGKRKDAVYCSGTCKAKYAELKKRGELNGLQLQGTEIENNLEKSAEYKTPEKTIFKTVDAIDLEPFMDLVGEINLSETEFNQENISLGLNEDNQSKEESEEETQKEGQKTAEKQKGKNETEITL